MACVCGVDSPCCVLLLMSLQTIDELKRSTASIRHAIGENMKALGRLQVLLAEKEAALEKASAQAAREGFATPAKPTEADHASAKDQMVRHQKAMREWKLAGKRETFCVRLQTTARRHVLVKKAPSLHEVKPPVSSEVQHAAAHPQLWIDFEDHEGDWNAKFLHVDETELAFFDAQVVKGEEEEAFLTIDLVEVSLVHRPPGEDRDKLILLIELKDGDCIRLRCLSKLDLAMVIGAIRMAGTHHHVAGFQPSTGDEVTRAFEKLDTDKSGKISVDELVGIMTNPATGHAMTESEARTFLACFDKDHDGQLDMDEFATFVEAES